MAIGTAILLGVGIYVLAALPVAVVVGRLLGGPQGEAGGTVVPGRSAGPAGAFTLSTGGALVGDLAHVAAGRPVALVARNAHPRRDLQLAGAEAHPAHA